MREIGNSTGAAATFREGVECLKPSFRRWPQTSRPLMTYLVENYVWVCKTADVEADGSLLDDILPRLRDERAEGAEG